jgi:hypothetical protein
LGTVICLLPVVNIRAAVVVEFVHVPAGTSLDRVRGSQSAREEAPYTSVN